MPESAIRAPIVEDAMEVAQMDEFEGNGLFQHHVSCKELVVWSFFVYHCNYKNELIVT